MINLLVMLYGFVSVLYSYYRYLYLSTIVKVSYTGGGSVVPWDSLLEFPKFNVAVKLHVLWFLDVMNN